LSRSLLVILAIAALAFVIALLVEHEYEERKGMLAIIGALLGGLSGFALENRFVRFSPGGTVWIRVVRTAAGLLLTVALFLALDILYDIVTGGATGVGALVVYVVRYGLVSLFVAAGAPWLFVRFRLADRQS